MSAQSAQQPSRADLLALADRVEAAVGPDRELDAAIAVAVGSEPQAREMLQFPAYDCCILRYTASLNAAMTLVPEGCLFSVRTLWGEDVIAGYAYVTTYRDDDNGKRYYGDDYRGIAATPAQALTAAALRARTAIKGAPS